MKRAIFIGLLAVVVTQIGVWLVCELVARSVAFETTRYRMIEPFFTKLILGYRNVLWLSAAAWVAGTLLLLRRFSKDTESSVAFLAAVGTFCIIIIIIATIACIL